MRPVEVGNTVRAAAGGDPEAWALLVERFSGLVWASVRGYGLSRADAADVSQTTWLRLAENLARIRQPEQVGLWLATTARNEALRTVRRTQRNVPVDPAVELALPVEGRDPDARLLDDERDVVLWRAFASLPDGCKALLRLLIGDPAPSYAEVASILDIPVGSIGPTRARCLDRLRRRSEVGALGAPRRDDDSTRTARV